MGSLSTGTGAYHLIGKREADPALLAGYPYLGGYGLGYGLGLGYGYGYPYGVVATAGSGSPVAVGGYKAVAGEGGAVHEVPGLFHAPAVVKQESDGGVSLSTGTSAIVHLGKREAEADAGLLFSGYAGVPLGVVATGGPVPAAVGGYRAVAGEGGPVHEVPGLVPAPALLKAKSAGGVSLTTGTGAVVFNTTAPV